MEITYRYKVGQRVKIVSSPLCSNDKDIDKFIGKDVTIIARGFVFEDESYTRRREIDTFKLNVFYYINEEEILTNEPNYSYGDTRYTKIYEHHIEGKDNWEVVDEKFCSYDNVELIPAQTKIMSDVILGKEDDIYANTRFSFSSIGVVMGFRKNYDYHKSDWEKQKDKKEIKTSREFLCYFKPTEEELKSGKLRYRQDSATFGSVSWHYLEVCGIKKTLCVNLPDNYADLFVDTLYGNGFYAAFENCLPTYFEDNWEVREWLNYLGVYEQVFNKYLEKMPDEVKKQREQEFNYRARFKKIKEEISKLSIDDKLIIEKVIKDDDALFVYKRNKEHK